VLQRVRSVQSTMIVGSDYCGFRIEIVAQLVNDA